MAEYTSNFNLYKPNRADSEQVDITLSDNFQKIDTEIKNRKDEIEAHKSAAAAHDSKNITHGEGTVQSAFDEVTTRINDVDTSVNDRITEVDDRLTTSSSDALNTALYVQEQLDAVVTRETDSDAMSRQAAIAKDGTDYQNLKDRLDTEHDSVTSQLADIVTNVKTFNAKGDNVTDDTQAIQNAIDYATQNKTTLYFPEGVYLISSSLIIDGNINIKGAKPIDQVDYAASNIKGGGFPVFSNPSTRIKLNISNLGIEGDNTSIGIDGQFGGVLKSVRFSNLLVGIQNEMSYNTDFIKCYFSNCDKGAYLENANSNLIHGCYFSGNRIGIETGDISYALTVSNCLINFTNRTEKGFILKGNVSFKGNYFEAFGGALDSIFLDYSFSKFNSFVFTVSDNYFAGAGYVKHAIRVSLYDGESGGNLAGDISNNSFLNLISESVILGTYNDFEGLNVHDNNPDVSLGNRHPKKAYKPLTQSKLTPNLDVSLANTKIPINSSVIYDNADALSSTSGSYTVRKDGVYRVSVVLTVKSSTADLRNATIKLRKNGVVVNSVISSLKYISDTTYMTISLDTIISAVIGNTFDVVAENAGTTNGGDFICEYKGRY